MPAPEPFYVGYLPEAPPELARWLARRVALLILSALALAVLVAATQRPFAASAFEYGVERELEGVLREHPYPTLLVERPGAEGRSSGYLLVGRGKHGAAPQVRGLDGRRVRLRGSLVHREHMTALDLEPGSLVVVDARRAPAEQAQELGSRTLRGEIVDSKCYLGVMKPGNLKAHRDCAVRCISGGVPPVLLVRDAHGRASYFLIAGARGESVGALLLDHVAEPIEITGRVQRVGTQLVLLADLQSLRRLD